MKEWWEKEGKEGGRESTGKMKEWWEMEGGEGEREGEEESLGEVP